MKGQIRQHRNTTLTPRQVCHSFGHVQSCELSAAHLIAVVSPQLVTKINSQTMTSHPTFKSFQILHLTNPGGGAFLLPFSLFSDRSGDRSRTGRTVAARRRCGGPKLGRPRRPVSGKRPKRREGSPKALRRSTRSSAGSSLVTGLRP